MKLNLYLAKTTMISNLDYTFNHFDKNAVSVIQSSQVIRLFSLISEDFIGKPCIHQHTGCLNAG